MRKSVILISTLGFIIVITALLYAILKMNDKIVFNKNFVPTITQTNYYILDSIGIIQNLGKSVKKDTDEKMLEDFNETINQVGTINIKSDDISFNQSEITKFYDVNDNDDLNKFIQKFNISQSKVLKEILKEHPINTSKQLEYIKQVYIAKTNDTNFILNKDRLYFNTNSNKFTVNAVYAVGGLVSNVQFAFDTSFKILKAETNVQQ